VFLLFAVVGALVLGTPTGASGKGEMMRLDNQMCPELANR